MNTSEKKCSCGAPLGPGESVCPQCLLGAALDETTIVPDQSGDSDHRDQRANLAKTEVYSASPRPHESAKEIWARDEDEATIVSGYRNLQATHDWSGGTVFRAHHAGLDRRVRLLVLDSSADAEARRAFLSRAERLSQINHPNTISILEAGQQNGSAFVAEERVDGAPLSGFLPRSRGERWREGFYPNERLLKAVRDAALGLGAIHDQGLTHGDLNPDSLIMDRNDTVRVIGLASAAEASDDRFAAAGEDSANPSVADDLHRLAAVFFYLTTGMLPGQSDPSLSADSLAAKMRRLNPGLRRDFCQLVADCLDPRISRFQTATELATRLNAMLERRVVKSAGRTRSYSMLLEGIGLLLVIGLVSRALADQWQSTPGGSALLILVIPTIYLIGFETFAGWTPVRRLFGIRLLNHAGDRFSWPRRAARALMKLAVLMLIFMLPALLIPLLARAGLSLVANGAITTFAATSPLLLLYILAWRIPSHWYLYDLLAGVTWAEEIKISSDALLENRAEQEAQQPLEVIDRADQYDICETLGEGGMGQVYRAHDRILDRDVAIKTLVGRLIDDPLLLERFQREARLAAKVSHNNVAKVFGTGIWNDTPYIAMELVDGRNLQEMIRESGPLAIETAWSYTIAAAEALAAADRSGVVHRDIKPANLMVTREGLLKVTDFGVSRPTQVDNSVTEVGTIVGTPAYMAPEQAMGKEVDCRCDIYALGMTLYHMLTGRPPFQGANVVEILAQQMEEYPPSLLDQISKLTPAQEQVFLKMIAKKPDDRYCSYQELLVDLKQFAPGIDRLASPVKRVAAELLNFGAFYFIFTLLMMTLFLLGRGFGVSSVSGTLIVGWTIAAMFTSFIGMYVLMTSRSGATPGKRALAVQVTGCDGRPVGYLRSAARFLAAFPILWMLIPMAALSVIENIPFPYYRYVSWVAMSVQATVLVASLLMLWLHPQRRTLHDLAAGTIVVQKAA